MINFFLLFALVLSAEQSSLASRHAITHFDGNRFGDRVLGYAQARYLSYLTKVPFLYQDFIYSDKMTVNYQARPFELHKEDYARVMHINSADSFEEYLLQIDDPTTLPTLFILDYFPSDISEWDRDHSRSLCLDIPWHDPDFSAYLNACTSPLIPIPNLRKEGCLNVADHVRTLSGADSVESSILCFPLKHPNLEYHQNQIGLIYKLNRQKSMHVLLFSDTNHPQELIDHFRNFFKHCSNITFEIQFVNNPDVTHVIEDFFGMQKFDALIATQSNFSMMPARLHYFDMLIYPVHVCGTYPNERIDRIKLEAKKSDWFPYNINTVIKQ